jgi:hypothetical protein
MKKRIPALLSLVSALIILLSFAFDPPSLLKKIRQKLPAYYKNYPQQKLYLHLDKNIYYPNDKIWFKTYLVNAMNNLPDENSDKIYVNLLNDRDFLIYQVLLKPEKGCAHGSIFIADTIKPGNYLIKAYTPWMNNFSPELVFKKEIIIKNEAYGKLITKNEEKAFKRYKKQQKKASKEVELTFFPEGGKLLHDLNNNLIIRSTNKLNVPVKTKGKILAGKNEQLTSFETDTNGFCLVNITPDAEKRYYATLQGNKKKHQLPEIKQNGAQIILKRMSADSLCLEILSNKDAEVYTNKYVLAGQSNGYLFFLSTIELEEKHRQIYFSGNKLPGGLLHFTLFNLNQVVESQRLIYFDALNQFAINIDMENTNKNRGDSAKINFSVFTENKEATTNLSLSITAINESWHIKNKNITDWFSFYSDISNTEQAACLSNNNNLLYINKIINSHNWIRFSWDEVLSSQPQKIQHPFTKGITIDGRITKSFFNIRQKDAPVELFIKDKYNDVFHTTSDENGYYCFSGLNYYDTINARLSARRPTGTKNVIIYISDHVAPPVDAQFPFNDELLTIERTGKTLYKYYASPPRDSMKHRYEGIYGEPDFVLYMDEISPGKSNLLQVIQGRVPGVAVSGNVVRIRGSNSLVNSDPLVLVDNMPSDVAVLGQLNPIDVERIEFVKGPKASMYGSRGANGIISVYTKRGTFLIKGVIDFKMIGYHTPKPFRPNLNFENKQVTIFWNPEIRLKNGGNYEVTYLNPEISTTVRLIIEGISDSGSFGSAEMYYQTK